MSVYYPTRHSIILTIYLLAGTIFSAVAQDAGTALLMSGTLLEPPPCTINNGQSIDIDFGEVGINKVNGENYLKRVDYRVTCDENSQQSGMTLGIKGLATSFSSSALQSSVADLGILLLLDGRDMTLNTSYPFDIKNPPELGAVPVKNGELKEGGFSAAATLYVSYQ